MLIQLVDLNPFARDTHILDHVLVYDNDRTNAKNTSLSRVIYIYILSPPAR